MARIHCFVHYQKESDKNQQRFEKDYFDIRGITKNISLLYLLYRHEQIEPTVLWCGTNPLSDQLHKYDKFKS